jgi:hypothetical protein
VEGDWVEQAKGERGIFGASALLVPDFAPSEHGDLDRSSGNGVFLLFEVTGRMYRVIGYWRC